MLAQAQKNIQLYFLKLYNKSHWFSDGEAWFLFRIAAFAEAVGWTLLIGAIAYRRLELPNPDIFVSIAGRVHGLFFVLYFIAVLLLARSMEWKGWRIVFALAAGIPPFGSLLFEKNTARHRKNNPPRVALPKNFND